MANLVVNVHKTPDLSIQDNEAVAKSRTVPNAL